MATPNSKISIDRRQVFLALLFILALYVLLPQLSVFRNSWHLLGNLKPAWTLMAVGLTLTTYLFAGLTYCLLASFRLRYREVVVVQFAAMLVNRLLPAGVGALGANYAYLRHKRHDSTQAATVVAVNNLLGIVGHALIVMVVLLLSSEYSRHLAAGSEHRIKSVAEVMLGVVVAAVLIGLIFSRHHLKRLLATIGSQIAVYKHRPGRLGGALTTSMLLTMCNVLCLYSCMLAVGVHLPFIVVILIFTFGLSTGTVTPTPGGLGGFEAGLTAGFVAYHIGSGSALAIALLFRLISYWLMLLVGIVAFIVSQRNHLFDSKNQV
jgi:uncharacterized membrane protein YbhN (UPF0104 family)